MTLLRTASRFIESPDNTRNETTFDFATSVYQAFGCLPDLFGDTLVDLDKEFNPLPASAESWSVADDGVTWSFKLREGLMWSDGTPVTAHDYVATFRLEATPEHGWDFSWFYSFIGTGGIRNWTSIVAGERPPEELGVRALDDLTLEVVTEGTFPPLPSVMKFSFVLQKRALEEHGPFYNNDVATSVSSGPYVLVEFDSGNRIVVEANPAYTGYRPARLARIEGIYMSPATFFIAFENGEVDMVTYDALTPANYALIERDPVLTDNYLRHAGNSVLRDRMFRDAERILVDDVGGVFIAHRLQGDLFKPYIVGDSLREPDANGGLGRHWGNDWHWTISTSSMAGRS